MLDIQLCVFPNSLSKKVFLSTWWFPSTWCWFGTCPTCRSPPNLFLCLGRRKRDPSRCCRPTAARPSRRRWKWTALCKCFTSTRTASVTTVPRRRDLQWDWMVKLWEKREACGRCFRPVCLGAFLVRYVWLRECHWNLLNSFTAGNICTAWFSHKLWPQFLHLLQGSWSELPHKLTLQDMHKIKASRDVKTATCSLFFRTEEDTVHAVEADPHAFPWWQNICHSVPFFQTTILQKR